MAEYVCTQSAFWEVVHTDSGASVLRCRACQSNQGGGLHNIVLQMFEMCKDRPHEDCQRKN